MHRKLLSGSGALIGAHLLLIVSSSATATDNRLETMVVTASRNPIPLRAVTGSMTVFTADDLARQKPIMLSDLLRSAPGIAVNRSGGPGAFTQVRMRGAEANHVLVLIDGIEANDVAQSSEFNFANLLSSDIAQVEVLRGPQSALWGSDALAGVISITTKQATSPFALSAFGEGGSFGTGYGGGSISGRSEHLHYRLSATKYHDTGQNISRTGSEKDGYDNKTIDATTGLQISDGLRVDAVWRHTDASNEFDGTDYIHTGLPIDANKVTDNDRDYGAFTTRSNALNDRWYNEVGIQYTRTDNSNYSDKLFDGSTRGTKTRGYWQSAWHFDGSKDHTLTGVIEREREQFHQRGTVTMLGDPNQNRTTHTTSYVAEYRRRWQSGWVLSLSSRYDDNDLFDDATSYRAGLLYDRIDDGWQLHAAYGKSVKNPTFVERFGYYQTSIYPFIGNPVLKPEQSLGGEAGVRLLLANGRFNLDATWFSARLTDEINGYFYDPTLGAATAINTNGKSYRSGVELSSHVSITGNLDLRLAYTFTDSSQPDGHGGHRRALRRPRKIASATINWGFLGHGNANININYNGPQQDVFYPPYPTPSRRVTLNDYTLVAAVVSWQLTDKVEVYARGENLLDEHYEEVYGFRSIGRGGFVGIRYQWRS